MQTMAEKQPDDGKESSENININGSQVGVAGKDVHVDGGIHYHYYQPQSPPAASEIRKDSGNTATRCKPVKVFISYAREDIDTARRLYADLKMAGIVPWMDKIDLLPGQNWKFHITKAVRESSYFIALLSSKSLSKRGFVQKELQFALDILEEFSDDDVFFIPARLDDCEPADEKLKYLQWADLFPSYEAGRDEIFRVFHCAVSEKTEESDESAVIASVKSENKRSESVIASVSEPEKEFTNSLGMKFVYIPPGIFMMGSPENEHGRSDDETLHKVTLTKGFYMETTQVTVGHWRSFIKAAGFKTEAETGDGAYVWTGSEWKKNKKYYWDNPGFPQTDEHPVTCVSWNDVQAFITWLNEKEKKFYSLPTEAQWEYACRAGSDKAYCFGDNAGKLKEYAWYEDNSDRKTHPVAQLASNVWGLHDMHGNVWEWCADWYGAYLTGAITDPVGTYTGPGRVSCGGCWYGSARNCRSAYRCNWVPGDRHDALGFRVQRS